MEEKHYKYIIVGAGLSGLTTAYELDKRGEQDLLVIEGRARIGGRILTSAGIDLGATWFQDHHVHLSKLMDDLQVERYRQYAKGTSVFVYSSMAPAQYFDSEANGPGAFRIAGGSQALIDAVAHPVLDKIVTRTIVTSIQENEKGLSITTSNGTCTADKVVVAMPPMIASKIEYSPALPQEMQDAMVGTHTWMSNAIKLGISYDAPFWREKKLSGTIIGHVGPVIELYDHGNMAGDRYALMGFVNEGLRDDSPEDRKERILSYLSKHLGKEAYSYSNYQEYDWSEDPYTSHQKLKSVYISPRYGNPILQKYYLEGKLLFSGAEVSEIHGGYMDGAVLQGQKIAHLL